MPLARVKTVALFEGVCPIDGNSVYLQLKLSVNLVAFDLPVFFPKMFSPLLRWPAEAYWLLMILI
jgi:hypothetical protein